MKKQGHPDRHPITIVLTTGEEYESISTYGKAGDRLVLDVDCHSHQAWSATGAQVLRNAGRLSRHKKRYSGLGISDNSASSEA